MNKIEIEIPKGKEIDWQESAKQEKIVFKDKQLTYENMCKELFKNGYCYAYAYEILANGINMDMADSPLNAKTRHQLKCILAKNMLANTARYLNGSWKWELGSHDAFLIIEKSYEEGQICLDIISYSCYYERNNVLFKSEEAAQQAIEILGEETVKLALTPLY